MLPVSSSSSAIPEVSLSLSQLGVVAGQVVVVELCTDGIADLHEGLEHGLLVGNLGEARGQGYGRVLYQLLGRRRTAGGREEQGRRAQNYSRGHVRLEGVVRLRPVQAFVEDLEEEEDG
ncbi:hypothetical protein KM043_013811 [Ampulex compressa]|nr:hypothetical protein KM043_013811 [Ampulex compressa]